MLAFSNQILLLLLAVNAYLVGKPLLQLAEATTRFPRCIANASTLQECIGSAAAVHATESFGSSLFGTSTTPARQVGMRSEFIHRDKLSGSTATTFQRLQQAIRRSNSRALRIGSRARAFSTNSTAATSRLLYDFTTPLESDQFQPEYLMQLQLGTPVTTFHAIADTGSDLVWVQCLPCLQCYKTNDSIFDPSNSSSYSQISCSSQACQALGSNQLPACSNGSSCPYLYGFGDKSVTIGDLSNDTVTMNTTTGVSVSLPIAFGCGHNNSGISFSNDSGGIVGLGRGPLSLISQLSSVLVQEQFSYCMVAFEVSIKTNSPVLFGSAAALSGLDILTTPILDGPIPSFYYVGITGIDVGGSPLQIPGSSFNSSSAGTIFDSGTSLTYLEANAYAIVKSTFASLISLPTVGGPESGPLLCYDTSSQPNFQPPSFTIHFLNGSSLSPPPANYFISVASSILCLAIGNVSNLQNGPSTPSILGNILQQNYHILYDLSASQISFQPATCDAL